MACTNARPTGDRVASESNDERPHDDEPPRIRAGDAHGRTIRSCPAPAAACGALPDGGAAPILGVAKVDFSGRGVPEHGIELYEPMLEAFDEARTAGKVLHLAMTGHGGGMQECMEAAIEEERYQVLSIKYDFVSYPDQDEILRRAAERGMGTIVFKTNAGNRQHEIEDLEAGGLSFPQATV